MTINRRYPLMPRASLASLRRVVHCREPRSLARLENGVRCFAPSPTKCFQTIVEEFQKGYVIDGRVIRTAKVKVAAAKPQNAQNEIQQ